MTLLAYLAGDDHAHNVRLNDFGLTTHADGSVGFGGIVFDDPDGTLVVRGWMEVIVVEDECIEAPILFRGWIGDRTYVRQAGQGLAYKQGIGRYIDTNLVDPNDALVIRLLVNADAKRPPETDIRRINWILGGADPGGLDGLVLDLGLVDRDHPRPFQDADWRGSYARDVLEDLAAPLGRIFFVYINQPDGTFGLFYDFPTSTTNTSVLAISNDSADTSDTCFYPFMDGSLHRDPSNMISLERFVYRNGVVLEGNTDTYNDYFSAAATGGADLGNRGDNVSNDRVGEIDTARTMADGNLNKNGIERDTLTVTVIIPARLVGLLDVGMRVPVKMTHLELEGYAPDFVYLRVIARQIQQYVTNENYVVTVELSNDALRDGGGGGSTGPGDFPHPPATPPTIVQQVFGIPNSLTGILPFPAPPTVGNQLIVWIASRGTSITLPAGWTDSGEGLIGPGADFGRMMYRDVIAGESANIIVTSSGGSHAQIWEVNGWDGTLGDTSKADVDTFTQPATINAGTLAPVAGVPALLLMGLVMHCSDWAGNGPTTMSTPTGWTTDGEYEVTVNGDLHPNVQANSQSVASTSGTYGTSSTIAGAGFNFGGWGGIAITLPGAAGANPPDPSQDVPWEEVTMTTVNGVSAGTTQFPFADRSLHVKVQSQIIDPSNFVEDDPLCGDFHLTWEIDADEHVFVRYEGR